MKIEEEKILGSEHIPHQHVGSELDVVETVEFGSRWEAEAFYLSAKTRLTDVNQWASLAKLPMSAFKLFDQAGRTAQRSAQETDFIRIDIPGPGSRQGKGYDWVVIESIFEQNKEEHDIFSMRVRPSAHPLSSEEDTAHFYTAMSTSNFQVKRIGCTVFAEEHSRNEDPNIHTSSTFDNVRNTLISWGAKIGISYPQWKSLIKGIMSRE